MEIKLLYNRIHENPKNRRWNKFFKIVSIRMSYCGYMFPLVTTKKSMKIRKWYSEAIRIKGKWPDLQHITQKTEDRATRTPPWYEPKCSGIVNNFFSTCYKPSPLLYKCIPKNISCIPQRCFFIIIHSFMSWFSLYREYNEIPNTNTNWTTKYINYNISFRSFIYNFSSS